MYSLETGSNSADKIVKKKNKKTLLQGGSGNK